jgi:acetyl-CoA synthetase
VTATKPGSCTEPLPGIDADIVDDHGVSVRRPDGGGYLVIRQPWPSMLRTIWRNNERYIAGYWEKFGNRYYVAGDSAHRDKDGYFWIMGRIDDVLKVSGHRLGTMEIESALVANPKVAEAAVVGKPHDIKGESVFAFVVLRGPRPTGDTRALTKELRDWVGEELGPIAKPDDIRFADNLPKTRSGKIMRRLLKSIARGEEITQDVSTLENPGILAQLRGEEAAPAAAAAGKTAKAPAVRARAAKPAARAAAAGAGRKRAVARRKAAAPRRSKRTAAARKSARPAARKARIKRAAPARRRRAKSPRRR